jgi:hypothetical protein
MALILTGASGSTTLDSSAGLTFSDTSNQAAAASPFGLKNRIINGDMRIDQRNAGASTTPTTSTYSLDRWISILTAASKFSVQQNAGSVTPPAGFTNYLGVTSLSAYSVPAGDFLTIAQKIEGYNIADLGFGTANAKTITISFWVRSSITGTLGGCLINGDTTRSYPFTYTISSANTWEQKTVTILGDTSGTWAKTTSAGMSLNFGLAVGSTYSGAANSWSSGGYYGATGVTNTLATNGATLYITGVQLEIGTSATPFERRLYGQELANCQRYYIRYGHPVNTPADGQRFATAIGSSSTEVLGIIPTPCSMRATPTSTYNSVGVGNSAGVAQLTSLTTTAIHSNSIYVVGTFASGISSNSAYQFRYYSATAFMDFSAEL